MDINEIKSTLTMENFYFSRCSIERGPSIEGGKLNVNLTKRIEHIGDHKYDIELSLTIDNDDLHLVIIAKAHFIYGGDDFSREETIVHTNTIAIMYPYVRSQVSLMTAQPGMTPIVLPPINTSKLK